MLVNMYLKAAVTHTSASYVFTDAAYHWLDACAGGVEGDRCREFGSGSMGVHEQTLKHRGYDAGGFPPFHHHHCHDTGTWTSYGNMCDTCVILAMLSIILIMCVSLQVNKIVAMKLCDIGVFKVPIPFIINI